MSRLDGKLHAIPVGREAIAVTQLATLYPPRVLPELAVCNISEHNHVNCLGGWLHFT